MPSLPPPSEPTIAALRVSAYEVPTNAPESDGTLAWASTTLVLVELTASDGATRGIGWTYAHEAAAVLIDRTLRGVLAGRSAVDAPGGSAACLRACRNLGTTGLVAGAVSAIDVALWDLHARLLGVPLVQLLGGAVRDAIDVYGSGGFTSYSVARLEAQLAGWVQAGIPRVKMKVGREPARDEHRVRAARRAIGTGAELFVDANGAYDRKQALAQAERFAAHGVTWFEEPVVASDLDGLRLVRDRAPAALEVAGGEYGWCSVDFRRLLDAGAVDVLQADATRCGGATGFLQAAAMCRTRSLPLSAHCAPNLHAHLCCAALPARHVEWFHDHVRIEEMFFDGALPMHGGTLRPDRTRPGLGLVLRAADVQRWQVFAGDERSSASSKRRRSRRSSKSSESSESSESRRCRGSSRRRRERPARGTTRAFA